MAGGIVKYDINKAVDSAAKKGRFAFVTFIIMNDSFVPGALMFAYGLRQQNVKSDIVCLVSGKVSKSAVCTLHILFDKVIDVDEVFVNHSLRHGRQDRPFLFSRFNALRLGKDGDLKQNYKKIILCDADLLPIKNYENLFDLRAPAGIINEHKDCCMSYDESGRYIVGEKMKTEMKWCWHEKYDALCLHGQPIPKKITDRVGHDADNMGVNAFLWIIEPDMCEYEMIMEDIYSEAKREMINRFKWPEMQYATLRWSGLWTNVDLKYSGFNGYPCVDALNGLHYAGTKPWRYKSLKHLKHFFSYPDYRYWYMLFMKMMNENNRLFSNHKLKNMYMDIFSSFQNYSLAALS